MSILFMVILRLWEKEDRGQTKKSQTHTDTQAGRWMKNNIRQNLCNNIFTGGIKTMVTEDILNLHCSLKIRVLANSFINSPINAHIHPQKTASRTYRRLLNENKIKCPMALPLVSRLLVTSMQLRIHQKAFGENKMVLLRWLSR